MMVLIGGCHGRLTGVYVDTNTTITPSVCDNATPHNCGVRSDQLVTFYVWGEGKCDVVGLDLGNGDHIQGLSLDFGQPSNPIPWQPTYMYRGSWPGPKTVRAYPVSNCNGEVTHPLNVLHGPSNGPVDMVFRLAYAAGPPVRVCERVPNTKPLRQRTEISIRTSDSRIDPNPRQRINFGCVLNGCIYDADGEPNSSAPSNFPFPSLRKYSLVFRVGNQPFQGGTNASFNTGNNTGYLEVCVNDDNIADNVGGWRIDISVDESRSQ